MTAMDLTAKHCIPCQGGTPKMRPEEIAEYFRSLQGWSVHDDRLEKQYRLRDFVAAIRFVNAIAELAENEGHHPDFCVHYATVDVAIWTHKIGGLTESDFILAAKIDELPKDLAPRQ